MRINTNISSMTAQESASHVSKQLTSSLETLSSGLRINKASDDASGMAIADKLRTQASSLGQSINNANSGNALVQIADKAMAEQSNILDIVKTKLIQAATSTTSAEGREAIRKDVGKLLDQLDNIANQTNYNGINLLDTKGETFNFQVGEDDTYDIEVSTAYAANTDGLGGGNETYSTGAEAQLVDTGDAVSVRQASSVAGSDEHVAISGQTNTTTANADATIEVSANNVKMLEVTGSTGGTGSVVLKTSDANTIAVLEAMVDGNASLSKNATGDYTFAATAASQTGVLNFGDGIDLSKLEISGLNMGSGAGRGEIVQITTDSAVNIKRTDENVEPSNEDGGNLQIDGETAGSLVGGNLLTGLKNLSENELTAEVANSYMEAIDEALNQINTVRSDFGSTQNQLDSFIRNAMTTQTNIKAAESVIRDVDYASESANFNKQNIVAQAGTYAMSQANAIQQNVLRRLQ